MNHELPRMPWPFGQGREVSQQRYRSAAEINRQVRRAGQAQRRGRGRA
ncbi:MAG: hypothetical protein M9891_14585 [Austwickia sp.]|nr:hypothetical protein [Actinomycetota bacterium]MCB1254017.1 hypothetical protein [Austwickia sp.]MCO5310477.1 hypothetical protein [Austwickia sp.]